MAVSYRSKKAEWIEKDVESGIAEHGLVFNIEEHRQCLCCLWREMADGSFTSLSASRPSRRQEDSPETLETTLEGSENTVKGTR